LSIILGLVVMNKINNNIYFKSGVLNTYVTKIFISTCKEFKVTRVQILIIRFISEQNDTTLAQIALAIGVTENTVESHILGLKGNDYFKLRQSKNGEVSNVIYPTSKLFKLVEDIDIYEKDKIKAIFSTLSYYEKEDLFFLMTKLMNT